MDTVFVRFATSKETKKKAEIVAKKLGVSLESLLNTFLTQFIKKEKTLQLQKDQPNDYLKQLLDESAKSIVAGNTLSFKSKNEVLHYIDSLIINDKAVK